MTLELSSLVNSFEESATLALAAKAKKLAAEGRSIINFGVGEPDFNTPDSIIEAAIKALRNGQTKYTAVGGRPELRSVIAARMTEDYGVKFLPEETVASCGGKQAIFHFLQAVIQPGDEVIIPSPYWVSFPEMVKMVGGKPVIVRSKGLRLDAADLEKAITSQTKLIILNSPSNPAGTVYSRDEWKSFLTVLKAHEIWLMSDDTYYMLTYGKEPWTSPLMVDPTFKERTCIIGSTSKSYAMTGWRLGWAAVPRFVADAMIKLQSQVTSNPPSMTQAAAIEALGPSHSQALGFREQFRARLKVMRQVVHEIPGISYLEPEGAFYLFVNIGNKVKGSVAAFSEELLVKEGVCVIPGVAFGEPDYIRLSFALSEVQIVEGLQRLKRAIVSS